MWQLYKTRKGNLEKLLAQKKDELKSICVKEAVNINYRDLTVYSDIAQDVVKFWTNIISQHHGFFNWNDTVQQFEISNEKIRGYIGQLESE